MIEFKYSSDDSSIGQSGNAQWDDVLGGEGDQCQISPEFQRRSWKSGLAPSQRPVGLVKIQIDYHSFCLIFPHPNVNFVFVFFLSNL
jgi:hypothetical protein